jgi:squalene-associated FAD-dependent desaturase
VTPRTHIVGAGLAGISAAVRLAAAGRRVVLYEAGPVAGGRCRSYFDEVLGCRIDNGNHLLLSGNRSALGFLETIGAADTLTGPDDSRFPFVDLQTNERWTITLGNGRIPWWIFKSATRVPGTKLGDYWSAIRFARTQPGTTVETLVGANSMLYRRFWAPLAVAALNTAAAEGDASLLWPVLKETFARGGAFCRPRIARVGLSESFVDPALQWLKLRGAQLFVGSRVRSLGLASDRATLIEVTGEKPILLDPGDRVVVAVPPPIAAQLLPGLTTPDDYRPIVNAHFRVPAETDDEVRITGVIGGTAEWIFERGDLISVTVSAAERIVDRDSETLAAEIWGDVVRVLERRDTTLPPWRIVKEKRATFAQTPIQVGRRPKAQTAWRNVVLAGDWTDTGLPATIEGAIRSGETAARCVLAAT